MRAIQCLIISIFAILSASGTAPWGGYLGKYLLQRPGAVQGTNQVTFNLSNT